MQGTTEVSLDPVSTDTIDSITDDNEQETGSEVLQTTGLTYLWQKIKAKFAAIAHSHSASDIISGMLDISRGGTGASTAAAARSNLGVTAANIVNGNAIAPSRVEATGAISGTSVSDSVGSLAEVRTAITRTPPGNTFTPYSGFTVLGSYAERFGSLLRLSVEVQSSTTHSAGQVSAGKWNINNLGGLGPARVGPSTQPTGYPAVCQLAGNGEMRFYINNNADKFWGIVIVLL